MTLRAVGGLRRSLSALAAITSLVATMAASTPNGASLRVLQLNLCNSGLAGCFTGRAVPAAAALIRRSRPHVVTLNEVCADDVRVLGDALRRVHTGGRVVRAFAAAPDRPTGRATRCRNGDEFGVGVLAHLTGAHTERHGSFPVQDEADPEIRVWLCVGAADRVTVCTTHLASTSTPVAQAQCAYLFDSAIPSVRGSGGPTVVGGDLNLRASGAPSLAPCLRPGYLRAGDGALQHVFAETGLAVSASRPVSMGGATDHPALFVALARVR